ncbi:replication protein A 32 kDa subunit A-like isoform X1 [Canna indica]|uniref:Replication protein A 32 kDa subunit A-like isoform X1 n=1 Tax=Canna indica TaxID=4628 RepID=A0AAQ3QSG9_9LILI|nr:replication protein A 32 kDa subunit A-like isoform X1 [Canna indica]
MARQRPTQLNSLSGFLHPSSSSPVTTRDSVISIQVQAAAMIQKQFHGAPSSFFAGTAFAPSPATQIAIDPPSPAKNRGPQGSVPLTAKQITGAYHSSDDKYAISLDGVDATNVRLLGLVMNKVERVTDVSFTLNDGTGQIDINRWVNEVSDANEVEAIQNGIYVKVHGHLKGFQSKKHAFAFSVRPVVDFNEIVLHYIECIYAHIEIKKVKIQTHASLASSFSNGANGYQVPLIQQFSAHVGTGGSGNNIHNMVLGVFQEPTILAREHGLHIDEVVRKLGIPNNIIMDAINFHVNVGHIYSTIDEYHFKSAYNG